MAPAYLAFAFLFFPITALADTLHIPITRRSRSTFDRDAEANRLRMKYGFIQSNPTPFASSHSSNRRGAVSGLPVFNQNGDSSYVATLNIGTPSKQFLVVLDTGSSDLWLPSQNCATCTRGSPIFDTSASSSFQTTTSSASNPPITISYGSGTVHGALGSDTVSMGGFTVPDQSFLSVDKMTTGLVQAPASGLMGLAFQSLASTGALPFWQALIKNNQLTAPEMSFWLARDPNTFSNLEAGGTFTLGGTNSTLFTGEIDFVPMPQGEPTFWLLSLTSLTANNVPVKISTGNNAASAIDTGTTLIGGPTSDVQAFYAAIPGSAASANSAGFFTFPCDTQVSVSMSFGGKSWPINPQDMNIGQDTQGSSQCAGAIFDLAQGVAIPPGSGNPSWVIGDTFLKNVYTVFRASPGSVGFAQLSAAAGGSGAGPSAPTLGTSVLTPTTTPVLGTPAGSSASNTGTPVSGAVISTKSSTLLILSAFTAVIMLCL